MTAPGTELKRLESQRELVPAARCVVCGAGESATLASVTMTAADLATRIGLTEAGDQIRYELCTACGLVYRDPRPSSRTLAAYYAEVCPANEPAQAPDDADRNPRYARRRRARFRAVYRSVRPLLPDRALVVDVGALDGASLLPFLAAKGTGVAVDPGFPARTPVDPRISTYTALDDFVADRGNADCVISTQTFEHLLDPVNALREALRAVSERGVVLVEVPYDLLAMLPDDGAARIDAGHPEHLSFFTDTSLRALAREAGGDVVSCRVGVHTHAYGGLIPTLTLIARRRRGGARPACATRPEPITSERLRAVLASDRTSVRRLQRVRQIAGIVRGHGRW
jgi:hypothetical protein